MIGLEEIDFGEDNDWLSRSADLAGQLFPVSEERSGIQHFGDALASFGAGMLRDTGSFGHSLASGGVNLEDHLVKARHARQNRALQNRMGRNQTFFQLANLLRPQDKSTASPGAFTEYEYRQDNPELGVKAGDRIHLSPREFAALPPERRSNLTKYRPPNQANSTGVFGNQVNRIIELQNKQKNGTITLDEYVELEAYKKNAGAQKQEWVPHPTNKGEFKLQPIPGSEIDFDEYYSEGERLGLTNLDTIGDAGVSGGQTSSFLDSGNTPAISSEIAPQSIETPAITSPSPAPEGERFMESFPTEPIDFGDPIESQAVSPAEEQIGLTMDDAKPAITPATPAPSAPIIEDHIGLSPEDQTEVIEEEVITPRPRPDQTQQTSETPSKPGLNLIENEQFTSPPDITGKTIDDFDHDQFFELNRKYPDLATKLLNQSTRSKSDQLAERQANTPPDITGKVVEDFTTDELIDMQEKFPDTFSDLAVQSMEADQQRQREKNQNPLNIPKVPPKQEQDQNQNQNQNQDSVPETSEPVKTNEGEDEITKKRTLSQGELDMAKNIRSAGRAMVDAINLLFDEKTGKMDAGMLSKMKIPGLRNTDQKYQQYQIFVDGSVKPLLLKIRSGAAFGILEAELIDRLLNPGLLANEETFKTALFSIMREIDYGLRDMLSERPENLPKAYLDWLGEDTTPTPKTYDDNSPDPNDWSPEKLNEFIYGGNQ